MKEKILKLRKRTAVLGALIMACVIFSSCYVPSPLYGNWADNDGNKISFIAGGTFVATVNNATDQKITYEGSYVIIDNVIVFSTNEGITINTEWDIRGSMLYLTWTAEGVTKKLVLYHISK